MLRCTYCGGMILRAHAVISWAVGKTLIDVDLVCRVCWTAHHRQTERADLFSEREPTTEDAISCILRSTPSP